MIHACFSNENLSLNFSCSYDPEEDRWTLIQPMHSKRLGVGVAVVNRLLYAIGGFDGDDRLPSMECYHPENNAWTILPSMQTGRSGAGVAALNQYIYVVGGFDGRAQLSSVERYDTEQQTWEQVASIKIARSALSLTVLDGKLFAMGGFDGHDFLRIVEVYDPITNRWEEGTPLTSGRSGHASAVIYQPACASIYMDGIEESDRKPPQYDENNDSDGTGESRSLPSNSSQQQSGTLHSFSGDRCEHCDNTHQAHESHEGNGNSTEDQDCCSRTINNKAKINCRQKILLRFGIEPKTTKTESIQEQNTDELNKSFNRKRNRSDSSIENSSIESDSNHRTKTTKKQCMFINLKRRLQRNINDYLVRSCSRPVLLAIESTSQQKPITAEIQTIPCVDVSDKRSKCVCNSIFRKR